MGWRTVIVDSRCKLSFGNNYLIVKKEQDVMIHVSEIDVLVVATTQATITCVALAELAKNKVKIIFCDEKHDPLCETTLFSGCYNSSKRLTAQIAWDDSIKGEVVSFIIRQKILNQAKLLEKVGLTSSAEKLRAYADELEYNDATNREGHAAKVYFNSLFGKDFSRDGYSGVNFALDYGYMILLSCFNREVVANGCITQLGLKHCNEFNTYNLSCDLIEPFRVLIDEYVYNNAPPDILTKEYKYSLISLLSQKITYDREVYLTNAVSSYVRNVITVLNNKDLSKLKLYEF